MKKFDIERLVRTNVLEMKSYSSARDEFQESASGMIFLDANESPYGDGLNRYPDPKQTSLKRALSKLRRIGQDNIILGNGSDELLDLLFRAFCAPNRDSVITLPPTYGMYGVLANLNAVRNKEVKLNSYFQPDVDQILNAVDFTTKIIFLCSPNNPTGNSFSEESIAELVGNFKGLVVIDEAYIDFSAKESWIRKISDFPNLVIVQTLSKAHAMAGIRLGIIYADHRVVAILDKIKPPYNINDLTQKMGQKCISNPKRRKIEISHILKNRRILEDALSRIGFIEEIFPSDANFLLVKVDDAAKRYRQIIDRGVVVRNRSDQELCENCLRITVGTSEENKTLIKILNEI